MKKIISILFVLVASVHLYAVTITDNFDSGISLANWAIFHTDAAGAPWTVQAPDNEGRLLISKTDDNSASLSLAGIKSKFLLEGDFVVSTDFECVGFPIPPDDGWNEALITVATANGTIFFHSLKEGKGIGTGGPGYFTEGFTNLVGGGLTTVEDPILTGKLGLSRNGNTISSWIDRGDGLGRILISSYSSDLYLGEASVSLWANQQKILLDRSHTALDVRFDNFIATADAIIIPEPATLSLLALGGSLLRKRKV